MTKAHQLPLTDLQRTIHNERAKYFAASLDRASTACFAVGALGPVVALLSGNNASLSNNQIALVVLNWLASAIILHVAGRYVLGRLK